MMRKTHMNGMNAKEFNYIDKLKLVPWLENEINILNEDGDDNDNMLDAAMLYSRANAYTKLLDMIHNGFFQWEQGSE